MGQFAFIVSLFSIYLFPAAGYGQGSLHVTVKNVGQGEGSVRVGLFDNSRKFPKDPVYGRVAEVGNADSVTVSFERLPAGTYAVSVIHDVNDNGKLDTNFLGIPKEGFAFGNNAMGMMGPPSFEKASIRIANGPAVQVLHLKHF